MGLGRAVCLVAMVNSLLADSSVESSSLSAANIMILIQFTPESEHTLVSLDHHSDDDDDDRYCSNQCHSSSC